MPGTGGQGNEPGVVFVLGACPVEIIGPVRNHRTGLTGDGNTQVLHTSGLKVGSQAAMLDWMFETASLPQSTLKHELVSSEKSFYNRAASKKGRVPAREFSLNIIGLPEWRRGNVPEWFHVLSEVGLNVVGNMPYGADLSTWRSLSHASATFVADRRLYPRLFEVLEGYDQEIVEVPLPIGVKQTDAFYRTIGKYLASKTNRRRRFPSGVMQRYISGEIRPGRWNSNGYGFPHVEQLQGGPIGV